MGNAYCVPGPHVCEHLSPAQDNVLRSLEGVEVDMAGRGQSLEFIRDRYTTSSSDVTFLVPDIAAGRSHREAPPA